MAIVNQKKIDLVIFTIWESPVTFCSWNLEASQVIRYTVKWEVNSFFLNAYCVNGKYKKYYFDSE